MDTSTRHDNPLYEYAAATVAAPDPGESGNDAPAHSLKDIASALRSYALMLQAAAGDSERDAWILIQLTARMPIREIASRLRITRQAVRARISGMASRSPFVSYYLTPFKHDKT